MSYPPACIRLLFASVPPTEHLLHFSEQNRQAQTYNSDADDAYHNLYHIIVAATCNNQPPKPFGRSDHFSSQNGSQQLEMAT